jgi:3-oxoadipate enol-lactonase
MIKSENISLHYRQQGTGDPVLLWPSLFSTAEVYLDLIDTLSTTHQVIILDPPGHGKSIIHTNHFTLEECLHASLRVLDQLKIEKVCWLGVSWGGLIGTLAALRRPERIQHLTCMGTPFLFDSAYKKKTRHILLLQRLLGNSALFVNGVAKSFFLPETRQNDDIMQRHRNAFGSSHRGQITKAARHIFRDRKDIWPMLQALDCPSLVIHGTQDRLCSAEMEKRAAERIGANYIEIEASHNAPVDKPHEIIQILLGQWNNMKEKTEK